MKRTLSGSVAVVALSFAGIGHAAQDAAEREARATNAISEANQLSARHGRYTQLRGAYLEGASPLARRAETWNESALAWVNEWFRLYAMVDLRENVPYEQFESALATAMRNQATTLTRLTNEGSALAREAARKAALAGADAPARYSQLASYQTVVDTLARREGELRSAYQDIAAQIPARIEDLAKIDQTSRVGLLARLKAALLARRTYPMEQTLASVQALLNAEAVVDPLLAELSRAEQEMTRASLALRIHRAEELNAENVQRCERARATLASLTGPAPFLTAARRTAEQLCASSAANYRSVSSLGASKAQLVTAVLEGERRQLPGLCARSGAPAECEKLAILAAIPAAKVATMSGAELKFVELEWASLLEAARQRAGGS